MPCVGMLHPNVAGQALEAGAREVTVVGCPADDCAQREGSLWIDARLGRTRAPRLKHDFLNAPIFTARLPPNEFAAALKPTGAQPATAGAKVYNDMKPVHFLRASLLLAAVLALQAVFTDVRYQPFAPGESLLQLGMRNEGELRNSSEVLTGTELGQLSHDEQVKYLN